MPGWNHRIAHGLALLAISLAGAGEAHRIAPGVAAPMGLAAGVARYSSYLRPSAPSWGLRPPGFVTSGPATTALGLSPRPSAHGSAPGVSPLLGFRRCCSATASASGRLAPGLACTPARPLPGDSLRGAPDAPACRSGLPARFPANLPKGKGIPEPTAPLVRGRAHLLPMAILLLPETGMELPDEVKVW